MSAATGSRFGSARLIVRDLWAQAEFYRAVFGLGEGIFIADAIKGRAIEEIIFMGPWGSAGLILLEFKDGNAPSPDSVMLLFFDRDIAALEARVLANGGSVFQPISDLEIGERTTKMAIYADPEGFLLEVIEGE